MAVLSILEQFLDRAVSFDEHAMREYTRKWRVVVSALTDDAITVTAAPGIPRMFDLYVGSDGGVDSLGAACRKIEATHVDDFVWEVFARYSNKTDQPALGDPDPLNRPAEIDVTTERFQRPMDVDANGLAVVNSSNEKFDPPVEKDDSRPTLRITRNESSAPYDKLRIFKDTVNFESFYGYTPLTVKVAAINYRRAFENGIYYWSVTYEFHVNPDTWLTKVLDQGTVTLNATGKPVAIVDVNGQRITTPQLLNGEGKRLCDAAASTLNQNIDAAAANFLVTGLLAGWPTLAASFPITIQIDSEQMSVSSIGGSTFFVSRGVNGTTAAAHTATTAIKLLPVYRTLSPYIISHFTDLGLGT